MRGVMSSGTTETRIRSILAGARQMFGADTEFQLHLTTRLDRDPAPLLLDRMWFGEVYDMIEPRPAGIFQRHMDEHADALKSRVARARTAPYTAFTNTMSELIGEESAQRIRTLFLAPFGFRDVLLSDLMSSSDRLLIMHTVRKTDLPFTESERILASMLIRALGPIVDQHVTRLQPTRLSLLSKPQLEALHSLLTRAGEVEASVLDRLLVFFNAPDREGLLASFVHPGLLEEIGELIRVYELEEADSI
jgi:hypothetical protein